MFNLFNWFRRFSERRDLIQTLRKSQKATGKEIEVTERSSIQSSAVFASIRVIDDAISTLPIFLNRRRSDGWRERAPREHPVSRVLNNPNDMMTRQELISVLMTHVLTYGNAYLYIDKKRERPVALLPLNPATTEPVRTKGELMYNIEVAETPVTVDPSKIVHIKGLTWDGVRGISPILKMQTTIALDIACTTFGKNYFLQGSQMSGILVHPGKLNKDGKKNLRESLEDRNAGLSNAHRFLILQEAMTFIPTTVPPEQAQFLESRGFNAREIASRIFKVPPHMIGDMEAGASFASIEQQNISFWQNTIKPWVVKIEQALNMKLLLEAEKDEYYIEFEIEGLLRGDLESQDKSFATGVDKGWYSINNVLQKKNLPPVEGGDTHYRPLNMTTVEGDAMPQVEERSLPEKKYELLFEDAARRVLRKEINAVTRAVKKHQDPTAMIRWADDFYTSHEDTIRGTFLTVVSTYSEPSKLDSYVAEYRSEALKELSLAMFAEDRQEAVSKLLDRWDSERPSQAAKYFTEENYDG